MGMISKFFKRLLRWFLQGLVLVLPLGVTAYLLFIAFKTLDGWFPGQVPGLGIVLVVGAVTLVGALGSTFIAKPMVRYVEKMLNRAPLVKVIYGSVRDLLTAFVGEEKKFNQPVLVSFGHEPGVKRLGFLTMEQTASLGLPEGYVGVYLPHSYNFSGNLVWVPSAWVEKVNWPSAEVMKLIVSGGVVVPKKG